MGKGFFDLPTRGEKKKYVCLPIARIKDQTIAMRDSNLGSKEFERVGKMGKETERGKEVIVEDCGRPGAHALAFLNDTQKLHPTTQVSPGIRVVTKTIILQVARRWCISSGLGWSSMLPLFPNYNPAFRSSAVSLPVSAAFFLVF